MSKKKVILDCDPGHDDAFAIMLSVQNLDVLGITCVGGNTPLENVTRNALTVLEAIGHADEVPVFAGCSHPMVADLVTAPMFHGKSGLDGHHRPEPVHKIQREHAVDFIADTVMSTDDVTILATGPLTNVAEALNREPRMVERVKEICIMGGSVTFGNWTPTAEFNIFVDPEAAARVFNSGIHVKMCGLNLTRQSGFTDETVRRFREMGTEAGDFAADLTEFFMQAGRKIDDPTVACMHDACAAAWVIDPSLITSAPMHIDVELSGRFTRGMTVCDYRHLCGPNPIYDVAREPQTGFKGAEPNAEAALELDYDRYMQLIYSTLRSYG